MMPDSLDGHSEHGAPRRDGSTGEDRARQVSEEVRTKARRMARARRQPFRLWRSLAHAGVLGWMFVLPLVAFALLGRWAATATGIRALSLLGLLVGLVTGAAGAWRAIQRAMVEPDADTLDDPPEAP